MLNPQHGIQIQQYRNVFMHTDQVGFIPEVHD